MKTMQNNILFILAFVFSMHSSAQTFTIGKFSANPGYGIPNGAWLAGDINGDGKSELIHAVNKTNYVNIWAPNQCGDFFIRPPHNNAGAGYVIPNGIWLTADIDGDGKSELIHAVNRTNYLNIWKYESNQFNVSPAQSDAASNYDIPNGAWLAGDIDGDGTSEIIHAVKKTNYVNIWKWDKDKNRFKVIQAKSDAAPNYDIPNGAWMAGDIDGDGTSELIHAVNKTNYVNIWKWNKDSLKFKVRPAQSDAAPNYGIPNGIWLAGDIDGDGTSEVIHAVNKTNYVNIWKWNKGENMFKVIQSKSDAPDGYSIPNGEWMIGDLNGDKKYDLIHAVANTNYVHMWYSNLNLTVKMEVTSDKKVVISGAGFLPNCILHVDGYVQTGGTPTRHRFFGKDDPSMDFSTNSEGKFVKTLITIDDEIKGGVRVYHTQSNISSTATWQKKP